MRSLTRALVQARADLVAPGLKFWLAMTAALAAEAAVLAAVLQYLR